MNVAQYALGLIGTLTSWLLMGKFGRRALFFYGLCTLFCFLMVIGGLGVISQENMAAAWALGSLLLVYTYVYNCTVGPLVYCIVSEVPSTRVKIKTVVIARNVYNLVSQSRNCQRLLIPSQGGYHQQHHCSTNAVTYRLELGGQDRIFFRRSDYRPWCLHVLHVARM